VGRYGSTSCESLRCCGREGENLHSQRAVEIYSEQGTSPAVGPVHSDRITYSYEGEDYDDVALIKVEVGNHVGLEVQDQDFPLTCILKYSANHLPYL
jgi:hypothetical protein